MFSVKVFEYNRLLKVSFNKETLNFYKMLFDFSENHFTYYKKGYQFTTPYKEGLWDGKIRVYKTERHSIQNSFQITLVYDIGFKEDVINFLRLKSIPYEYFSNSFFKGSNIERDLVWDKYKLRDYQERAVESLLRNRIGIISLPTGSGKMLVASNLIYRLGKKTILVVRNLESVKQTRDEIQNSIKGIKVGVWLTNNKNIEDCDVILTTFNSLKIAIDSKNELFNELKKFDCCIVDEAHHISTNIYKKIINYFNFYYVYGMTGTAYRNDNSDIELKSVFGNITYKVDISSLQERGVLSKSQIYFVNLQEFIPDKYNFLKNYLEREPTKEELESNFDDIEKYDHDVAYKLGVVFNELKNHIIKSLLERFYNNKKIVLVKYIYHGEYLSEFLQVPFLNGKSKKKDRELLLDKFRTDNNFNTLIASNIYDESINIPELEIVINAGGHSSNISQIQRHGRVVRRNENKEISFFIDFFESFDKRLEYHARKRIGTMKKEGLNISILNQELIHKFQFAF